MSRFARYNTNFQRPAAEQYVVAVVANNGNIVGYAPAYNAEAGFAIVPDLQEAMKYPRSSNAYSRCKGMHVARSLIVSKISAELADIDSKMSTKQSKRSLAALQKDRSEVQTDFDEVCAYQFQIQKI